VNKLTIIKQLKKIYSKNLTIIRYLIVGIIATLFDWSFFYLCNYILTLHYQISLGIGFTIGTLINYTLNRLFTFMSKAKHVISQMGTHFTIALSTLLISLLIMYLLVDIINLTNMISRIITTAIVFFINYILHKNITFNKKYFKEV